VTTIPKTSAATHDATPAAAAPVLDVHDVTVAYHRRPVLWDVDLTIAEPGLIGIVGPNVDWDFPVSVLDVVLMGTYGRLGWFRRPGRRERAWALECLRQVGLADLARQQIGQLSGGQQQRTFLARALAQQADLYFMDEPMAGVDAATERVIFSLLGELRRQGKTVLVVHHDLRTVPEYFEQVVLLNMRLVASGPTERVFTRENLQKTYGGRLDILDDAADAVAARERSR
jgi:manganese/zinc/iron transport system ATP- binding protein